MQSEGDINIGEQIMKIYILSGIICLISSYAACVSAADSQTTREAGSLVAWGGEGGYYDKGQTVVPEGHDYVAVAAGMYHSLALRADGSVIAWGGNDRGQCDVPSGHNYQAIAAGFEYSLALTVDGQLIAWGSNENGQCDVPAGSDYVEIAAGAEHGLARRSDGSVVAWGHNGEGQCDVPHGLVCRAIAGAWRHSLALRTDGSLMAWGANWNGEINVPDGNDFVLISAGDHHNMAQRADGSLVAWGGQANGRCDVPPEAAYARIFSGGGHHNLLIRFDGLLLAWGDCSYGKCEVPQGKHYIAISAGTHHNLAIKWPLVVMDYVIVDNPGNPDDEHEDIRGGTYGAVPYVYRMGQYEVTAAQYCAFLNAVAVNDTYGLYDPRMAQGETEYDTGCRIRRCRPETIPEEISSCSDTYTVDVGWANRPVNFVDFWDACRFANWLHNGQPVGPQDANTTEDGAYPLNGYTGDDGRWITRNPDARVWIPSADEWYKAAYHKNDGVTNHYWDYPTGSDLQPSNELLEPDPGNNANFSIDYTIFTIGQPYWRTEVGEFENSASPYGTYDQAGNMREWTDSIMKPDKPYRTQHGCSYGTRYVPSRSNEMGSHGWGPEVGNSIVGFRVAAQVWQD